MKTNDYKICVNCKHYRAEPEPRCFEPRNLIGPPFSLVTGKPMKGGRRVAIINLEIIRAGAEYCGEAGIWYDAKTPAQTSQNAPEGQP